MATVHITRVADEETRTIDLPWTGSEGDDYMWSEGNYACDCNRALFFARANGEPDPKILWCSRGKYRVKVVVDDQTVFEG